MAFTESTAALALGTTCPAFELPDVVTGRAMGRDDIFGGADDEEKRKGLIVAFLCVHCPFVKHLEDAFGKLASKYADSIATVAISSNDIENFPQDAPEHMKAQAQRLGWSFPYLFDSTQETAREFRAACTPDIYLFNANYELTHHAQFDNTRPATTSSGRPVPGHHAEANGADLEAAIQALLNGGAPIATQTPSLGCNIKWRQASS